MRYISTRGKAEPRNFSEILLEGLAPDGGLYVPEEYPQFDLDLLRQADYIARAYWIIRAFAPEMSAGDLGEILSKTYTARVFGKRNVAPLQEIEGNLYLLRLSNGPTLAFKDLALQFLAPTMEYELNKRWEHINILAATSGDTGSAAEYAFKGKKGINVFMLSPKDRMSVFQQRQMYTLNEPNIFNLVLDGTFDDCQSTVKEVSADALFKRRYRLGTVNSINWARIVAQVVYWVHAYFQATSNNRQEVMFAVPSGNFGNALSAWVAKKMGLPVRRIVIATNENDVLHQFFLSGTYRIRRGSEVKVTSSPSMDIASASNFERFIFDLVRDDAPELVPQLWDELKETGEFNASFLMAGMVAEIESGVANEMEVLQTIRLINKYGFVIDPHTAVAMKVGLDYRRLDVPLIVAETAQPAKFPDTIHHALGFDVPIPSKYKELLNLPKITHSIGPYPGSVEEVKAFITASV